MWGPRRFFCIPDRMVASIDAWSASSSSTRCRIILATIPSQSAVWSGSFRDKTRLWPRPLRMAPAAFLILLVVASSSRLAATLDLGQGS